MSLLKQLFERVGGVDQFVIVTVIETSGSAPRETGARMVVTDASSEGSIGGGNLEHRAIRHARKMLAGPAGFARKTEFCGLGVVMRQCCGGAVRLMYEKHSGESARELVSKIQAESVERPRFLISPLSGSQPAAVASCKSDIGHDSDQMWNTALESAADSCDSNRLVTAGSRQWFVTCLDEAPARIALFGAGHVGKALVRLLQDLPFQVDWVDQRADMFPSNIPANTRTFSPADPCRWIEQQPAGVFFLVMTHDHGLDYELCLSILRQRNFCWLGLIGSETKRKRFAQRLLNDGIDSFTLQRLVCPIGVSGIRGKSPAVIALSTAAQLLELRDSDSSRLPEQRAEVQA